MQSWLIFVLAFACASSVAQDTAPVRLRATVQSYDAPILVIKERDGRVMILTVPEETGVVEVIPTDITSIQPGSFVGTAALPRADGKLESIEVVVFPDAARGVGEGHYPWDLKPDSSMTNATVAALARSAHGRTLLLRYKDGEKTVIVPDDTPVVTFGPGNRTLIVPGARVFIVSDVIEGQFIVRRLLIGRNGFQPPM